jgi:hypothetical protein
MMQRWRYRVQREGKPDVFLVTRQVNHPTLETIIDAPRDLQRWHGRYMASFLSLARARDWRVDLVENE